MDQEMDLIVFSETGHVMAGATRTQTAGPAPAIDHYVGDGLWLREPRSGAQLLSIAPSLLSVETVARRDEVLMTARHYQLVEGLPESKDELGIVAPVMLDGTDITVTLPAAAATLQPVDCVVVVQGAASLAPFVQRLRVQKGDVSSTEPMPLHADDYACLLLVPGYRQQIDVINVP